MEETHDRSKEIWARNALEPLWEVVDRPYLARYLKPHVLSELKCLVDEMSLFEDRDELVSEVIRAARTCGDRALGVALGRIFVRATHGMGAKGFRS